MDTRSALTIPLQNALTRRHPVSTWAPRRAMVAEFDPGSVTDPESADPDLDHVIANGSIDTDLHRHIDVAHHLPTNASADLDPKNDPLPVLHNLANFSSSHFSMKIEHVNAVLW